MIDVAIIQTQHITDQRHKGQYFADLVQLKPIYHRAKPYESPYTGTTEHTMESACGAQVGEGSWYAYQIDRETIRDILTPCGRCWK